MKQSREKILQLLRQQTGLAIKLLAVGVILILAGVPFFIQVRKFNASAIRAPGKIVELDRQQMGKDVSYFPVFSFVDRAGASHVIHSKLGSSHPRYAVGDAVEVLYPADDPEQARLNSFFTVWMWPVIFAGIGLILTIAGIVLWYGAVTAPVDELANSREER